MRISEIRVGQTVWFYEGWTNTIEEATITDIVSNSNIEYVSLNVRNVGMCNRTLEHIYPSEQACKDAVDLENKKTVDSYKGEITNIKTLVAFAITHCVGPAEEYTDYNARNAFISRAEELLGISDIASVT